MVGVGADIDIEVGWVTFVGADVGADGGTDCDSEAGTDGDGRAVGVTGVRTTDLKVTAVVESGTVNVVKAG